MVAPPKTSGFTLIELLITIAVLVILITLAAPAFNLAEQRRVIGAAESALNQLQVARTEAIKQGRDIYFASDTSDGAWCHGISDTQGCDCFETDENDASACTIQLDGSGTDVLHATQSDEFRDIDLISPTGTQEIRFEPVRGTVVGNFADMTFESSPNSFEMQVQVNAIGRPSACGSGRAMGAYSECDD